MDVIEAREDMVLGNQDLVGEKATSDATRNDALVVGRNSIPEKSVQPKTQSATNAIERDTMQHNAMPRQYQRCREEISWTQHS